MLHCWIFLFISYQNINLFKTFHISGFEKTKNIFNIRPSNICCNKSGNIRPSNILVAVSNKFPGFC